MFWTWGYCIRLIASPGFYFSKWVFGRGSIQNIAKKVDFWDKKWGFIQENPQKQDFSHYMGLYSRVGCCMCITSILSVEWLSICDWESFYCQNGGNAATICSSLWNCSWESTKMCRWYNLFMWNHRLWVILLTKWGWSTNLYATSTNICNFLLLLCRNVVQLH